MKGGLAAAFVWLTFLSILFGSAGAAHAQDDDPQAGIPDSLRFETVEERSQLETHWDVQEGGSAAFASTDGDDDFDLVFDELEDQKDEDWGIQTDYALAVTILPYLHFNRVDAWTLGIDFGFAPSSGWYPQFDVRVAQAFNRGNRWLYVLGAKQPVLDARRLLLGMEYRRFTDDFDSGVVKGGENFVSAFGFKYDYRDYFEREGLSLSAEAYPLPWLGASLTYVNHEFRSTPNIAPGSWTLFRNGEEWRANPAVDDGTIRGFELIAIVDRRDHPDTPTRGWWARLGAEWADRDLGGDFTYSKYRLQLRGYQPLPLKIDVRGRLILGTTGAGELPFQKEFTVGGISTLRATNYKDERGDHTLLFNGEVAREIFRGRDRTLVRSDVDVLGFIDIGSAWHGRGYDLGAQKMRVDVGLGVGVSDRRFRLHIAQNLQNDEFDPIWSIRLSSPF